jgi:hypothetical protein
MASSTEPILEKRGYFWWHGEKTPKGRFNPPFGVPGILTILNDGRGRLRVTDSLLRSQFSGIGSLSRSDLDGNFEVFKGRSIAGKIDGESRCVYLRNIVHRSLSPAVDGKPSEQFDADLCMIGDIATTRSEKSLRFTKLSISLAGLELWRENEALIANEEKTDGEKHTWDVSFTTIPIEYELEDAKLSFRTDVHCTALENSLYREIAFRQYDWLEYVQNTRTTPEALRQEFNHLEEFLAVLTGTYYSLDWPQISMTINGKVETFTLYFWRNIEKDKSLETFTLWTTFRQTRDAFGTLYSNWRSKRRQYGPGVYLYLGELRNRPMYIEHRFVNLIWGIESLHRGMNPEAKVSKSQTKRIQGILAKTGTLLNSDEHKWLDRQLGMSVEPPLDYRITTTFAKLPWNITRETLIPFAERCRIRRNNISHYGGSEDREENRDAFLRELMELTEGLTILYHAALLQEIGVDETTLMDCTRVAVGFRIRRGLKLAKLQAKGIKEPEPVDFAPLLKAQEKTLRNWRRRRRLAELRRLESQPKSES